MAVEKAVHVGEQHKQWPAEERCHKRGKAVVIAKTRSQFLDAHSVVFIDDWNSAIVEQCAERVADIEIAGAIVQVVGH